MWCHRCGNMGGSAPPLPSAAEKGIHTKDTRELRKNEPNTRQMVPSAQMAPLQIEVCDIGGTHVWSGQEAPHGTIFDIRNKMRMAGIFHPDRILSLVHGATVLPGGTALATLYPSTEGTIALLMTWTEYAILASVTEDLFYVFRALNENADETLRKVAMMQAPSDWGHVQDCTRPTWAMGDQKLLKNEVLRMSWPIMENACTSSDIVLVTSSGLHLPYRKKVTKQK